MTGTVALVALVVLVVLVALGVPGVADDLTAAAAGTEASASAAQIPVPTSPIPTARALRPAGAGAAPPAREVRPAAREIPRIRSPPFASAWQSSRRGATSSHDPTRSRSSLRRNQRSCPKTRRPEQDVFPAQAGD